MSLLRRPRLPLRGPARFARCARGVAAVEFALVGWAFFALVIGAFEVGRALYVRSELAAAADVGVRMALLDPMTPAEAIIEAVREAVVIPQAEAVEVEVSAETSLGVGLALGEAEAALSAALALRRNNYNAGAAANASGAAKANADPNSALFEKPEVSIEAALLRRITVTLPLRLHVLRIWPEPIPISVTRVIPIL